MKSEERGVHVKGFGREAIDEVCGIGKSISPVGGRHRGLEKKSAGDIVGGADHALGFPILLRGIWAGHAEGNAFGKKEGTRGGVIKLTSFVTLH